MPTDVIMPQMGESIAEGTVIKWYKKPGDKVERDEPLFEISTDKVDTEIPAPASGVLTEVKVAEGQTVPINTVVAIIGGPPLPEAAAAQGPPLPEAGVGEARRGTPPSPAPSPPAVSAPVSPPPERHLRSSPLVRRLAREHDVDLGRVQGTGRDGRITKHDVLSFIEAGAAATAARAPAAPVAPVVEAPEALAAEAARPAPATETAAKTASLAVPAAAGYAGRVEAVPMSNMRKSIAEHMIASRRTSAHVTTVFEADMTRVVALREEYKARFAREEGVKLTYTPFFIRAVIGGLKAFPILNSSVDGDTILYKKDLNIGIAVALDWGLIVPVVHRADEKSFLGLSRAVNDLAERARSKKLKPEEVQGGTFTITNPGPFGSLFGTPIVNQPQVAILGLGGIHKRPVVVNDAIAVRSMIYMALSFDHRIIDGAVADQFMAEVRRRLENWEEKIL
ncbi:MAG: dihydrolipoamide acetyltransferase family protein [Acidobacteriota bacterium]